MSKWPFQPTVSSPSHEIADLAELLCWREHQTSVTQIRRSLTGLAENDYSNGVQVEEIADQEPNQSDLEADVEQSDVASSATQKTVEAAIDEAFEEIQQRQEQCGTGYPFEIGKDGYTLNHRPDHDNIVRMVYKYLLLATRLDMSKHRTHAEIDGTLLFERLCEGIARTYFGDRSEGLVFGYSSQDNNFSERVDELCAALGEGIGYRRIEGFDETARDGKLDVVVWKPFADGLPGKLIGFGQCKTGTNYQDTLEQLQPDTFCRNWLHRFPAVLPIRMFFVAEALRHSTEHRYRGASSAGILFDRCRIIDFIANVDHKVLFDVAKWVSEASVFAGLPHDRAND